MLHFNANFSQVKLSELQAQLSSIGVSEFSTEQDIRTLNHKLEQSLTEVEEETEGVELKILRQIILDIGKCDSTDFHYYRNSYHVYSQEHLILCTVGRSFPSHYLLVTEEAAGRPSLLRILALYAAYNPRVGCLSS